MSQRDKMACSKSLISCLPTPSSGGPEATFTDCFILCQAESSPLQSDPLTYVSWGSEEAIYQSHSTEGIQDSVR